MRIKDSLGDRMKHYEHEYRARLFSKTPVIMRLDGKAFHTFTRKYCNSPFDKNMSSAMVDTARVLVNEISGAKLAFIQSDEISILITDYDKEETQPWFGYNIQKMCSVSASIASFEFSNDFSDNINDELYGPVVRAIFDSRVFNIPRDDIANYFIWRQRDWERNSVQMLARIFFSQKELNNKNTKDLQEMVCQRISDIGTSSSNKYPDELSSQNIFIRGWYDLPQYLKYGTILTRTEYPENVMELMQGKKFWESDEEIERFNYDDFTKKYINNYI